jgi:hypothetical protein
MAGENDMSGLVMAALHGVALASAGREVMLPAGAPNMRRAASLRKPMATLKPRYNPLRAAILRCHQIRAAKAHPVTRVPLNVSKPNPAPAEADVRNKRS